MEWRGLGLSQHLVGPELGRPGGDEAHQRLLSSTQRPDGPAQLEPTVAELANRWGLVEIGTAFLRRSDVRGGPGENGPDGRGAAGGRLASEAGSACFVAPVRRRDGRRLVLKVTADRESADTERLALEHWRGSGAVAVEAAAPELGAILLERAEPGTPLAAAGFDEDQECRVFCGVVERLQGVGRLGGFPTGSLPELPPISSWLDALLPPGSGGSQERAGSPTLTGARARAHELGASLLDGPGPTVLHGDLHHENILASGPAEAWVAIDPKGILGPPEAEAAAFLRNPRDRLLGSEDVVARLTRRISFVSSRLGFDEARVAAWAFVLAVVASAWAQEDEGHEEADRWLMCALALQEGYDAVLGRG